MFLILVSLGGVDITFVASPLLVLSSASVGAQDFAHTVCFLFSVLWG